MHPQNKKTFTRLGFSALLIAVVMLPLSARSAGEAALAPTQPQDGTGPVVDLLKASGDALRSNAKYNGALAEYRALKELVPQARAKLLPQINLFGDYTYFDETIEGNYYGVVDIDRSDAYTRGAYGAVLSQTVFNTDEFYGMDQAELRVAQAAYALEAAQSELLVRVAESYFALLMADGNFKLSQAKMNDLYQQLEQLRGRAAAGLATRADVKVAEAEYELSVADQAQASNAVIGRRARLTTITGEQYGVLKKLPAELALEVPQPASEQVWIERTLKQNPAILARKAALQVAEVELKKSRFKRLPKLEAVGSAYALDSSGGIEGERREVMERIGLRLTMPLYSGGQISSDVREAQALLQRAEANLQDARAQAVLQTRLSFLNTTDGLKRVLALKRAVDAATLAVDATFGGFESGTRTYSEVLSAIEKRYSAQSDYGMARYTFLVDSLKLRQDSGMLLTSDIARINNLLKLEASVTP